MQRIRALSFIFLLSSSHRCLLEGIAPADAGVIMEDAADLSKFEFVDDDVVLACRKIQKIVKLAKDEQMAKDALDRVKVESGSSQVKAAVTIVQSVMTEDVSGEATLLIEALRPFLVNCVKSQLKRVEGQW